MLGGVAGEVNLLGIWLIWPSRMATFLLEPDPQVEWTLDFAAIQVCLKISYPIPSHGVKPHIFPTQLAVRG